MPVLSRILGWLPPDNRDYVEVAMKPDQLQPLENPTFHISEPNPIKQGRHAAFGNFVSTSPGSSTSALSVDGDPPCQRRVETSGKRSDPNWVARPRNEFILFRCDYVRKHSREGKRIRKAPGAEAEKTLSKQAAEAWHHLSPEERLYWKERATGERNEHARRYPDYRYRPKKSGTGRRRPTRSSSAKAADSVDKASAEENGIPKPETSTLWTHDPPISAFIAKKPAPRRYSSVPELTATDPLNRRLRSTASHSWLTSPTMSPENGTSFIPPSRQYAPMPLRLRNTASFMTRNYSESPRLQPPAGIIHSTSSSLLNWNGERMVASPPQPTQFLSSTSVSLFSGVDIANGPTLSEFATGGSPIAPTQAFGMNGEPFQPNGDIWMPLHNYSNEDYSMRPATADELGSVSFDANGIQAREDSSVPDTPSSLMIYEEAKQAHLPNLVDYDMNSTDCVSVDMLGSGSASHDALFAMEAEELFTPIY